MGKNRSRRSVLRTVLSVSLLGPLLFSANVSCNRKKKQYTGWQRPTDRYRDDAPLTRALWSAMAAKPGMTAVDIGAGAGYFTFRLAKAVEPGGVVYAIDVESRWVDQIEEFAEQNGIENVKAVRASFPDEVDLEGVQADLIIMINSHTLQTQPREPSGCATSGRSAYEVLASMMKPGGRLVYHPVRGPEKLPDLEQVKKLLRSAGFSGAIEPFEFPPEHVEWVSKDPNARLGYAIIATR